MMLSRIPVVQALLREAERYDERVLNLAVAFQIPPSLARAAFRAYCRRQAHDWETCYYKIMGGRTDWLDAVQVALGTPE